MSGGEGASEDDERFLHTRKSYGINGGWGAVSDIPIRTTAGFNLGDEVKQLPVGGERKAGNGRRVAIDAGGGAEKKFEVWQIALGWDFSEGEKLGRWKVVHRRIDDA